MTTADVEDLLMEKVTDMGLFKLVQSAGRDDIVDDVAKVLKTPAALVCFTGDENTGVQSRLVTDETYLVAVVNKNIRSEKDAARSVYDLIDAVRDGIHGKQWGREELEGFRFRGRELIYYENGKIAYAVRFSVKHTLHIPTVA